MTNGEQLLREVQFKEEMEKLINSYIKDVPALHLMHTVQQACEQLKQIAVTQLDEARKEQLKKHKFDKKEEVTSDVENTYE